MDVNNGKSRSFSPAEKNDLLVVPPIKRRLSPPLKNRCLVLDAEDKTVEIRNEKEVKNSEFFQKIPIPPGQKQVTVLWTPTRRKWQQTMKPTDRAMSCLPSSTSISWAPWTKFCGHSGNFQHCISRIYDQWVMNLRQVRRWNTIHYPLDGWFERRTLSPVFIIDRWR